MISYWEKEHLSKFDHIVVGAGVSGLFTALFYKRKYPQKRLIILDKAWISCGASTKNAGFACAGSLSEILDDLEKESKEDVFQLFTHRIKGLAIIKEEFEGHEVYQHVPSYELINSSEAHCLNKMEGLNDSLAHYGHDSPFSMANERLEFLGLETKKEQFLVKNNLEGGLHTAKLIQVLHSKLTALGVQFYFGAEVLKIEEGHQCNLVLKDSNMQCDTVSICTNAFTEKLIPEINLKPARAQVLITKPIQNLKLKGLFHFDRGYYYFREIEGRVLFGGGRQLDIEGETTSKMGLTDLIQEDLERKLAEMVLPNVEFEIDQRWSGIMAFGKSKRPIVKKYSERISMAVGFGGMGLALAPYVCKELVSTL